VRPSSYNAPRVRAKKLVANAKPSYVIKGYVVNSHVVKRVGNVRSTCVVCGRWSDLETVPIPNGAFAGVVGHLEILGEFETIRGASVFT